MRKGKFLALSTNQRHSLASRQVRLLYEEMCDWLGLPQVELSPEALANRYHHHRSYCAQQLAEDHLLPPITHRDRPSDTAYLPIVIYLDHIRSAHNVGSILRTVEAFRLGTVAFSEQTPDPYHPQVQRTAMGTAGVVPWTKVEDPATLSGPVVALETSPVAIPITSFSFPERFTLVVGNEEYGCSEAALRRADALIQIPLVGAKNSLNVANALAIAAAIIRQGAT